MEHQLKPMKKAGQWNIKKLLIINLAVVSALEFQLPPYRQAVIVVSNSK